MKKKIKDWTILIYLDGNNDLEPEMWQSKIDLEKIGSNENVNVIINIGREAMELVKIIRPEAIIPFSNEKWTGVREYYILKGKSELIRDFGNINMADPHTLYNFITRGMKKYPAKKYMLILSGHGSSFIGVLPDLSQDMPYAMGITEMCKVINMIKIDTGYNIDVLVLDICNMNLIEILYELGNCKNNTVKSVLTYFNKSPISGMPYDKLIYTVQKNNLCNADTIVRNIIDNTQLDLIGIKLDSKKLRSVKKIVSELAYVYLTDSQYKNINIDELLNCDHESRFHNYYLKLNKKLFSMIIHYKNTVTNSNSLINIVNLYTHGVLDDRLLSIYSKLSFAKNNYWTYILGDKVISDNLNFQVGTNLSPLRLHLKGLMNLIKAMNPDFNEEKVSNILKDWCEYKGWNIRDPQKKK